MELNRTNLSKHIERCLIKKLHSNYNKIIIIIHYNIHNNEIKNDELVIMKALRVLK